MNNTVVTEGGMYISVPMITEIPRLVQELTLLQCPHSALFRDESIHILCEAIVTCS